MKTYYIYNAENDFYLGMVLAKDWVDARSVYAQQHGVSFGSVYACASPLQGVIPHWWGSVDVNPYQTRTYDEKAAEKST